MDSAPVSAYRVEAWQVGSDGGARWNTLGVSPINSFDAFNLKPGAEYHFRVTPKNRYGWGESVATSSPVLVGVPLQMPEFSKILPGQQKALLGDPLTLECTVKGHPKPIILWYKDGLEIKPSHRLDMRCVGSVCKLAIQTVLATDVGRYTCEATNKEGRVSTFVRLFIVEDPRICDVDTKLKGLIEEDEANGEFQPQFTMRLRDRRVQVTYPVRLTCQVIGSPKPDVLWLKDGEELKMNERFVMWNDGNYNTLEIGRTILEDSGRYTISARNDLGSVSCHCHLTVDKGIRAYIAPDFYTGLSDQYSFGEGQDIRLYAHIEAYPSVGVSWYKNGVKLRPSRRIMISLDHDGFVELVISEATVQDAGLYSCVATNAVGQAETSGVIIVESSDGAFESNAMSMQRGGDNKQL